MTFPLQISRLFPRLDVLTRFFDRNAKRPRRPMGFMAALFRQWPVFPAILVGLLLRLEFRVGLLGGNPQDDAIYVAISRGIVEHQYGLERYLSIPNNYQANPAEWFVFRAAFTYPMALMFRLFGEGDLSATLVPLIASLVNIWLVYRIGCLTADRRTGLIGAWLMAVFPLDIIMSTRVLTDVPFSCLTMAGIFCVLKGTFEQRDRWWLIAGLFFGIGYLTKILALPLAMAFSPALLFVAWRAHRLRWVCYFAAGLGLVLLMEFVTYRLLTGRFLLHSFIVRSASAYKILSEPWTYHRLFPGVVATSEGNFQYYLLQLLGIERDGPLELSGIGLHAYLWFAGLAFVIAYRRRTALLVAYGFVLVYLWLEIIPIHIESREGQLGVMFFCRQLRYLVSLAPFGAVLGATLISALMSKQRLFASAILVALVVSGWSSLRHDFETQHYSLEDLRQVSRLVRDTNAKIYVDGFGIFLINYYLGGHMDSRFVEIATVKDPAEIEHGFVIVGGCRGIELVSSVVTDGLPPWARALEKGGPKPNPEWTEVATIVGKKDEIREHDLRLFLVGGPAEVGIP